MEDFNLYDDDEAIQFVRNYLPQELKEKFSDDDIIYIIDLIYDFYESNGFLDGDDDDEVVYNVSDLEEHVMKCAKKDNIRQFTAEDIEFLVQGELAYSDYIGRIEDEEGKPDK
jgi:hypothetical protein